MSYINISNCYATGSVTGKEYVGGFIGDVDIGNFESNYSIGTVKGIDYVGGFAGSIRADNAALTLKNSYTASDVYGTAFVGGFAGYITQTTITGCTSGGDVFGEREVGNFAGKLSPGTALGSNIRVYLGQMVESDDNGIRTAIGETAANIEHYTRNQGSFALNSASGGPYYPFVCKKGTSIPVPNQPNTLIAKRDISFRLLKNFPTLNGINITSYNKLSSSVNALRIIAEYDSSGNMLHISMQKISVDSGLKTILYTPANSSAYSIRMFLWKNIDSLEPWCHSSLLTNIKNQN